MDLIRKYATRGVGELVFDPKRRGIPFAIARRVEYYGFELESEREPVDVAPPADEAARLKREYAARRRAGASHGGAAVQSVEAAGVRTGHAVWRQAARARRKQTGQTTRAMMLIGERQNCG